MPRGVPSLTRSTGSLVSDGPTNNGCLNCRGVVRVNSASSVDYNVEYWGMGHFSRFFAFPTRRIATTLAGDALSCITTTAFANAGNQTVQLVVLNVCTTSQAVTVNYGAKYSLTIQVPQGLMTLVWSSA